MTIPIIIGSLAGAAVGFGYYKLLGCPDGACPLARSPWISTVYGAVLGILIATSV